MKKSIFYFLILVFFINTARIHSQIIPDQRRIIWNPGIPEVFLKQSLR